MSTTRASALRIPVVLGAAVLATSSASILVRYAQADGAPSIMIAALRLGTASLLIAPFALRSGAEQFGKWTGRERALIALAGIFLAAHFASWTLSLAYTRVAESALLVSSAPLWVSLFAPIFLGEALNRAAKIGLTIALAGGMVIGLGEARRWSNGVTCADLGSLWSSHATIGNLLALAGALAMAGYLIIGRKIRAGTALLPYIFAVYGVAALLLSSAMLMFNHAPSAPSPRAFLWIFLLAAIPQLIGHSALNWALKYLPAAAVAVTTLGEPIGAALLAYFLLSETPSAITMMGGGLILSGIFLSIRSGI